MFLVPGTWRGFDFATMAERLAADLPKPPIVLQAYDELPEADPSELPPPPTSTDDVRWIYYTSGTTSDPKGVRHSDGSLLAGGYGLAVALEMSPSDVGSIAFPFAHIGGPDYLVTVLTHGFPVVLIEAFNPKTIADTLNKVGATMAGGSTAFYSTFLNLQREYVAAGGEGRLVPSLRLLSGGGAPKPPEIYFQVKREMGIPVAHGSPDDTDDQLAYSEGAPVRGCKVRIVGADGSDLPPGNEGEVRLGGPAVFHGYTDPALTADAFDEQGYFRTGDLGVMRPDGHITLTGRLKDVIIRKGENISAKEVEDLLFTHPGVADVAVIGLADPESGERACAVVVPAPDAEPITFDEMTRHLLDAGLITRKLPEQLEIVDALPRNPSGKIVKFALQERFSPAG
jgi:acyl-coenzyme A synthetase/AMP-(fatty) acid ligase